MNALCYKIVFSKRLGTLVAVGEHTSGHGKAASGTGTRSSVAHYGLASALKTSTFAIALSWLAHGALAAGPAVTALPTGASVNAGNVAISSQGAAMTIQQSSAKASVNWNSFNIGSAAAVNILQPSANSVLLNRVVGNDPSQIFGKLSANGQVVLINPNGVVFGQGGSVTASAFTASTFGLSDNDFAKGKYNYTRNGSTAGVTVQNGSSLNATAPGGYVALIGASVNNEGTISTQQGSVVMAAGETAALPSALTDNVSVPLSSKVRLELSPATLNASVVNSGSITTEGGQVLMQAAAISDAVASISHSGSINTTGAQGGAVTLQADGGIIQAHGSIKANSTQAKRVGGDIIIGRNTDTGVLAKATDVSGAKLESQSGFVETSGEYLKTSNISVKAAEWLLDPTDITIVATGTAATDVPSVTSAGTTTFQFTGAGRTDTSEVLKADIESAINNGTNVTLDSRHGTSFGAGNITIATALSFNNIGTSNATLRLSAVNGIIQNSDASITGRGNQLVNIVMDTLGRYSGQDADNVNSKGITLNSTINTNGTVNLSGLSRNTSGGLSNSGLVFNTGAGITASSFTVSGQQTIPSSSAEYAGIFLAGNNSFTSSGTSTMNGSSTSGGIGMGGVFVPDNVTVNFNSGAGSISIAGTDTYAKGIRLGYTSTGGATTINTNGQVTFDGGNEVFLRGALNVQSGSATLKANLVNIFNAARVVASDNTTLNLEGANVSLGSGAYTSISPLASANFNLNIKTDELSLLNFSTINTGAGVVNVTTKTAGNGIHLGTGSSAGILGLTQANLDSISAGKLWIGDANTTGQITTYTLTTMAATGDLTLRSSGNITLSYALTVGDSAGSKNLTLYGSDGLSANTISQGPLGSIKSSGLELKGSQATHTLTSTSNDITTLAGNTHVVNFIDTNGFNIGTVNTAGLTTSGDTSLTAGNNGTVTQTTALQAAGLELKGTTATYTLTNTSNDIATLAGNVKTLSYKDATGFAVGTVNTQGLITSGITTLEAGANGSSASVSQNTIITAGGLELKGSHASYTLNGAGAAGNAVTTFAASAKAVAFTNASALSIGTVNTTLGVTTNAGASIITQSGDLNVNQTLRNTGAGVSGDIVIGAGTSTAAGTGSGGDVKTTNGVAITQDNSSGKTFIYTGQTSSTGNLSYLNASLSNLDLSAIDGGPQNADSNVGYSANNLGISGSTANAQVMFREKVAIGTLTGDTLTKTYGDSATHSTASSALFAQMQAQLKTKNTGIATRTGDAAGTLRISNAALIDTLSGNLSNSSSSSSGYLNANSSGYGYGALGSSKYTYSLAANNAKVVVNKATAKLSAQRDYNGTTALSNVTIDTGVIGTNGLETLTFSNASSNNKNVSANGSNFITAITLANGANGGDASNYTYINSYDSVNNHVTINQAALSVTANAVTKTYDGTINATGTGTVATLAGAGDTVNNAGAQEFLDKNYGINNRTVRAYGVSVKDASSTDVTSNYNISYIDNITSTINQAALTIKVNDTSMFVTQDARTATNQLYSYSGFKNGENETTALTGGALVAANRSYTDPANTLVAYHPTAGSYSGVYGLTAVPTAVNNNYAITVQNGNLRVIPADKLLITITSQTDSYGHRTAANAGLASNSSVSAQYCLVANDCSGNNLVNLSLTQLSGTEWKATDSSGSAVMFGTTLSSPSYSTGGYVNAGNYTYHTTQISPVSLPNGNFTGRETNGGVLTVTPIAANLSGNSASKVYDGTADISGVSLSLDNLQSGDLVTGNISLGTLASKNAGNSVAATFTGINLSGSDAANYYLTSTTLVGTAAVTPKPLTLIGATVANKTFDGNTSSTLTSNGSLLGLIGVETLTLFGLTGTFESATVGQDKNVQLQATLQDGTLGGLASNYSLAPASVLANITPAQHNATQRSPIIYPSQPILPNGSETAASRVSTKAIANPHVNQSLPHAENTERCSLNATHLRKAVTVDVADEFAGCLCETQNTLGIDGLSICYEPKQTADNRSNRKPRI